MFNVSKYLERFKVVGLGEGEVKESLMAAALAQANISLEKKDIEIKNGVAHIKAHPLVKNQLQIKKTAILKALNEKLEKPLTDIR